MQCHHLLSFLLILLSIIPDVNTFTPPINFIKRRNQRQQQQRHDDIIFSSSSSPSSLNSVTFVPTSSSSSRETRTSIHCNNSRRSYISTSTCSSTSTSTSISSTGSRSSHTKLFLINPRKNSVGNNNEVNCSSANNFFHVMFHSQRQRLVQNGIWQHGGNIKSLLYISGSSSSSISTNNQEENDDSNENNDGSSSSSSSSSSVSSQSKTRSSGGGSIEELYQKAMKEDKEWYDSFMKDILGENNDYVNGQFDSSSRSSSSSGGHWISEKIDDDNKETESSNSASSRRNNDDTVATTNATNMGHSIKSKTVVEKNDKEASNEERVINSNDNGKSEKEFNDDGKSGLFEQQSRFDENEDNKEEQDDRKRRRRRREKRYEEDSDQYESNIEQIEPESDSKDRIEGEKSTASTSHEDNVIGNTKQKDENDEKDTVAEEEEEYIIQFIDMFNMEQRITMSTLTKLGYKPSDVVNLRAEVLELIIEDEIEIPMDSTIGNGDVSVPRVPRRWMVESKELREVKVLQKRKKKMKQNQQREQPSPSSSIQDQDFDDMSSLPRGERIRRSNKRHDEGDETDIYVMGERRRRRDGSNRRRNSSYTFSKQGRNSRRQRRSKSKLSANTRKGNSSSNSNNSIWMDVPTFKQYLRKEAELRLAILGDDWVDTIKSESEWRLNLYQGWLDLLEDGFGDDVFEEISYAPPEMREPNAPSSRSRKRRRNENDHLRRRPKNKREDEIDERMSFDEGMRLKRTRRPLSSTVSNEDARERRTRPRQKRQYDDDGDDNNEGYFDIRQLREQNDVTFEDEMRRPRRRKPIDTVDYIAEPTRRKKRSVPRDDI